MKAYRYYETDFQSGYVDTPQGDHLPSLSPEKQRAEMVIREGDKRGRSRAHAIFVFEKVAVARDLLDKTAGKHLYEMNVDEGDILHRADLRIYDEIVEALKRNEKVDLLVREFWQGIERPSPRIELAVTRAVVVRKLVDDDEK